MRLTAVRDVVDRGAPFVTIHTEVGRPTEDARQQLDARWTTIRHALEHEDVDPRLLAELEERLHEPPPIAGPARRTLVAADGQVVVDEVLAGDPVWPETTDVGLLPDLSGWLTQADRQHPFVLVVTDREGADIGFHPGLAATEADEESVQGEDFYVTKVAAGDWAQKQFQQSAENTWQRNAEEVADHVRSGLRNHPAEVVLIAGDDRARHLVEANLAGIQVPIVQVQSGGRAAGASQEALWQEVRRVLAEIEAHDDQGVIERLAQAEGEGHGAVHGLDAVMSAFVKGQVETLVLDLRATGEMKVDPAHHPGVALPEGAAGELPADRVLVALAAATDAEVTLIPAAEIHGEGVAALLRWDDRGDTATEV